MRALLFYKFLSGAINDIPEEQTCRAFFAVVFFAHKVKTAEQGMLDKAARFCYNYPVRPHAHICRARKKCACSQERVYGADKNKKGKRNLNESQGKADT